MNSIKKALQELKSRLRPNSECAPWVLDELQAIIDSIEDDSDVMSKATYKSYRECLAIRERIHKERVNDAHRDGYHMGTQEPYSLETHQIKACLYRAQQIVEDVEAMLQAKEQE